MIKYTLAIITSLIFLSDNFVVNFNEQNCTRLAQDKLWRMSDNKRCILPERWNVLDESIPWVPEVFFLVGATELSGEEASREADKHY